MPSQRQHHSRNSSLYLYIHPKSFIIILLIYFFFFLFRAIPAAHGSFLARGQIGATAGAQATAAPYLQPTPQLGAMLDP